jgi:hypothetical protein
VRHKQRDRRHSILARKPQKPFLRAHCLVSQNSAPGLNFDGGRLAPGAFPKSCARALYIRHGPEWLNAEKKTPLMSRMFMFAGSFKLTELS